MGAWDAAGVSRAQPRFYEAELLRRINPHHRNLGEFFQEEIASTLGLDVYIRLSGEIPNSRLATIAPPGRIKMLFGFPFRLMLETMNRHSNIYWALVVNPGTTVYLDEQRIYARNLEVPPGGAVGTARAIAQAYSVFATGDANWTYSKRRLSYWRLRQFRQRAVFTTNS